MEQATFSELEHDSKKRRTRREIFLEKMDRLIPWERLESRIEPFYPKPGRGRRPYPLATKLSTEARTELVNALARRYVVATRVEKSRILDEFEAVTGFHRKHAMRILRSGSTGSGADGRGGRRIYDDAVREALVVLWEASDRICGKRLKALMPTLVEAMERHGHLQLGPEIRAGVLAMSASTIDRSLREIRERAGGRKRRRTAPSPVRSSIPVRTFSDWDDPPPGFAEADLVAHSGPVPKGSFVQALVVTDVATGWTECAPVLYREQTLLREVLGEVA